MTELVKDYWQDFKAGRAGARCLAVFCVFLALLIYIGATEGYGG
jgi:hypothetical protein